LKKSVYVPSANVSDGSDLHCQVTNLNSRSRLKSVAIQPSAFSKRLSDANDKMITSSQNSGGNLSGITLAPA